MNSAYFNTGIYTVSEASRLTGVSTGRIRRWLRGYSYRWGQKTYAMPALWQAQWEPIGSHVALGFLDVVEIRFVDAFVKVGVTWVMLRRVRQRAQELFKTSHPFCVQQFVTDGRDVFVELHRETGESSLLEIVRRQQVFSQIVKPLFKDLEFAQGKGVVRWWPLGSERLVVLDPTRSFGRPIVAEHGVPTETLANAAAVCGSSREAARWFEVPEREVSDAVEYEQQLAA